MDMSNEREKAILGSKTVGSFLDQFGDDVHARILLEVLFEGLMHEETVFVFGEQEQTRDQTDNSSPR